MEAGVLNSPIVTPGDPKDKIEYKTAEDHSSLTKEDFMNLFVMQLQYQDPMDPMDTAEMSSQMAELNMVDLMYKNNEAMDRLVESDRNRTNMSAVAMMGHEVRYQGSKLTVSDSGPAPFDYELEGPAASVQVTVYDSNGQVVKKWETGETSGDRQSLGWDGTDMNGDEVEPGNYQVEIEAVDQTGADVGVSSWTTGVVAGVSYQQDGMPLLKLEDGTEVGMDKIWMVNS